MASDTNIPAFTNLCPELWFRILDYLDTETLSVLADTYSYLREIAYKCFHMRKMTKIIAIPARYDSDSKSREAITIKSLRPFFRVFRHFGKYFESADINLLLGRGNHVYNTLAIYSGDNLRFLHLARGGFVGVIDASRMFGNLEELHLTNVHGVSWLPLDKCYKLRILKFPDIQKHYSFAGFKNITFSKLESVQFHKLSQFDEFLQCTDVEQQFMNVTISSCGLEQLSRAPKLDKLSIQIFHDFVVPASRILNIGMIDFRESRKLLRETVNNNPMLEELHLGCDNCFPEYWSIYSSISRLRVLRLFFRRPVIWHFVMAHALKVLIKRKKDTIEYIEIYCQMLDFPFELYHQCLDDVCRLYNVSAVCHGPLTSDGKEELSPMFLDDFDTTDHIFARYGPTISK